MAKKLPVKNTKSSPKTTSPSKPPTYKSALGDLGSAVKLANSMDEGGYDVLWSFAVVANDPEGKPLQGVYLLAKRREETK